MRFSAFLNWCATRLAAAAPLLLAACSPTDGTVAPAFTDKPVVNATLVPGRPVRVVISRQVAFDADAPRTADDLNALDVRLETGGRTFALRADSVGGYTCPDTALRVRVGATYTLRFTFGGLPVTAETTVPTKPVGFTSSVSSLTIQSFSSGSIPTGGFTMPDPVRLTWQNPDQSYYLVVAENKETNPTAVNSTTGTDDDPPAAFRNTPTTAGTYEIQPMQFRYYGRHRLILYHIPPTYADLYTNSSNSSQNLTSPPSNITNGLGTFASLAADTLTLQVRMP